jgi:cytochrome bd ubiquinol oxidase subunit I
MNNLLAARLTMSISLGFHIIFACIGMTMPFLMVISNWIYLKKKDEVYLKLTKAWSKGVAIFFAVGAVSGTVLSFELGLLWPEFMKHAGPIIGMPFSWEGTAFFVEAICIGLFLYGWDKLNPFVHWVSGLLVGISGVVSGIFVVCANAWMNSPAGFDWVNGKAINIDPFAAMFNPAWKSETLHMTIAAFVSTSFAVAGLHAFLLLKNRNNVIHKKALIIALSFGSIFAVLQPLSGDYSAKSVAQRQPIKLAAMEGRFQTEKGAGLTIGGVPIVQERTEKYGIVVPKLLSFLAYGDFNSVVKGLDDFPQQDWPPILPVHFAFEIMVGIGFFLAFVGVLFWAIMFKWKDALLNKKFLALTALCMPLGFIAVEAGWIVTEVGRQPWILYGIIKTADAVTPVPGQIYHFILFAFVYLILSSVTIWLMKRQIQILNSDDVDNNLETETV